MNKDEYWSGKCNCNGYYKQVQKLLKEWKQLNSITSSCVVHHRDDNEDVIAYNEEHYERWGFDENGDFVEGKYVIFMTRSEHQRHHLTGKPSPMRGKTHTDKAKADMRAHSAHYWKGKKFSPAHIQNLCDSHQDFAGDKNPFYGKKHTEDTRMKMSSAKKGKTLSDETKAKIGASRKVQFEGIKFLYNTYKNNGGAKQWNEFQKALKNGEITFEPQPISVFVK